MRIKPRLIRNATIAALVGSTAGAMAGLWSVRDRTTSVAAVPVSTGEDAATSSASAPTDGARGESGRDPATRGGHSNAGAVATKGVVESTAPAAVEGSGSTPTDKVVQRARALAEVPDVFGLVALREGISRHANERGELESPATQALIREIDRYLAAARRLQLKRDGEALRRDQAANPPRTGR